MHIRTIRWTIAVALAGCGSSQPPPPSPPAGDPANSTPDRKVITQDDCEAQGGSSVGDIGDGATRRPDYLCPSGKRPLGSLAPPAGGPISVEGAVCCPK
jgi:hypothetical protein